MRKKILLIFILLLGILIPVNAKEDNFIANDNVKLKKSFNHSTFIAGNKVEVSSEIEGINFTAGNDITMHNKQDYLFAAGNNIHLEEVASKDTFVAGSSITITDSSIRDLYAAASKVRIDSNIEGNVYIGANSVIINKEINGNVHIAAEEIRIGKNASIKGTLSYPEDAKISIAKEENIKKIKTYKANTKEKEKTIVSKITDKVYSTLSLLVIGILLLIVLPKFFDTIGKKKENELGKNILIGFLGLIGIPLFSLLTIISIIGLPLGIISFVLYIIFIYLSIIPSSYYFGKLLIKDKIENNYLILTISLFAISLLELIPILGGFVSLICTITGLGLMLNSLKKDS